jgi:putative FmdB family regulatory protein
VAIYSYRCPECGSFELVRPMCASGAEADCPGCGGRARRLFDAPALRMASRGVRAALEKDERSADSPEVVRAVPAASRPRGHRVRYTRDPRHTRLPSP